MIKAKLLNRTDSWDRPLAIDKQGHIYCDITLGTDYPQWHTITDKGEPNYPVNIEIITEFID